MKKTIFKTFIIGTIFIGTSVSGFAQPFFDYNNRHLSQSHLWNPGFLPQYKMSLGFGINEGVSLVGGNLNSWFNSTETSTETVSRLINDKQKQIGIDNITRLDLFHFGFRSAKSYLSFNTSVINEASVRLPKDLLGLAFFGNGAFIENDADLDFSGSRLRSYIQNTVSYGRQITNEWSAGVNIGIINGIADLGLYKGRFGLQTDTGVSSIYQIGVNGELDGRASLLGGDIESAINDSNYNINEAIQNGLNNYSLESNRGYSVGFGAVYRMNKHFRFSGSVQNLGFINWDLGAQFIKMDATSWTWNGLDTNQINDLNDNVIQQLQDTITSKFDIRSGAISSYTTQLHPRYILGAEYFLTPRTYLQVTGGYGFGTQGDRGFVGAAAHQEVGEFIDLRFSYSYYDFDNPAHRVGVGFSLNLGPLQVHASMQDMLGIVSYGASNSVSAMMGVNINIGTWKDRDNDLVPDKRDSCFKTYGVVTNNGCPYGFLGGYMDYNNQEEVFEDINQEFPMEEEKEEAREESTSEGDGIKIIYTDPDLIVPEEHQESIPMPEQPEIQDSVVNSMRAMLTDTSSNNPPKDTIKEIKKDSTMGKIVESKKEIGKSLVSDEQKKRLEALMKR